MAAGDGLGPRRRRVRYRAWHRGMREMDLIFGRFADAHIGDMGDHDLADFEALMEIPDPTLFDWIAGRAEPAPQYRTALLAAIVAFHDHKDR
ncbi:MAG TPA: succinate dehydrogenase assembly factor 2 [Propylenella sp.]